MPPGQKWIKAKIILFFAYIVSFFIYYTGLLRIMIFIRRNIFKKYRATIIAYHNVGNFNPHYLEKPDYLIRKNVFARQIKYLKARYKIISLAELVANLKNQRNLTSDCVTITFDDGYEDNFLEATPILKKYNAPAIFFITSGFVDQNYHLNWDQIKKMQGDGFELGCHTISHPYLANLNQDEADKEIALSKATLEENLGSKIRYFSYPYGSFNEQIIQIVREAKFEAAVSTIDGCCKPNPLDLFSLKRKEILNRPFYFFPVKIEGLFENWPFSRIRERVWKN